MVDDDLEARRATGGILDAVWIADEVLETRGMADEDLEAR